MCIFQAKSQLLSIVGNGLTWVNYRDEEITLHFRWRLTNYNTYNVLAIMDNLYDNVSVLRNYNIALVGNLILLRIHHEILFAIETMVD